MSNALNFPRIPSQIPAREAPLSANHRNVLFRAAALGQKLPNLPEDANRLANFELLWIKSGSLSIAMGSENYLLRKNSLYLIFPSQFITRIAQENLEGYSICFSSEFLYMSASSGSAIPNIFSQGLGSKPRYIEIEPEGRESIEEIFKAMVREHVNNFQLKNDILKGLMNVLMVYLARKAQMTAIEDTRCMDSILFRKFMSLLTKNILIKKSVSDYAKELSVSPYYLAEAVKRISGQTVNYHIQQGIIHEAKKRAICSGESMKQIAFHLGFSDIAHFSKFFRNKSGSNFSDFKKGIAAVE